MLTTEITRSSNSFRDPDGFVFQYKNEWYRYVSSEYKETYDHLIESGLYEQLVNLNLLIPHQEVENSTQFGAWPRIPYKILKPNHINNITFPYEWSFSQLKEAALTTLKIQQIALKYKMSLKDASFFNIQLFKGQPVLIDTLSLIKHEPTKPWLAMGQFYRHFVWPLLAMSHTDVNLNKLFILYPDGFKIDTIQPWFGLKSWFNPKIFTHVHLHHLFSKLASKNSSTNIKDLKIPPNALKIMIERMSRFISKLEIKQDTVWKNYYQNTNYEDVSFAEKEAHVKDFIEKNAGRNLIDFGANNGHFSKLAEKTASLIYALDFDAMAVDKLYRDLTPLSKSKIIPLIIDLTNPSPNIGWNNQERKGILNRLPNNAAGLVLALTHHLHITYNINFNMQSDFFWQYCHSLMIEFIEPDDSQVIKLLNNRYDHPADYTQADFERAFESHFDILSVYQIKDTKRYLYSLKRRQ